MFGDWSLIKTKKRDNRWKENNANKKELRKLTENIVQ